MTEAMLLPEGQEFFKLNEVCKIAGAQPYMLRFWGSEFPDIEAAKSDTGQRLYSREQVEVILEVRRLLFDEGLTVPTARKRITAMKKGKKAPQAAKKPETKAKKEKAPEAKKVEASAEKTEGSEPSEKPRKKGKAKEADVVEAQVEAVVPTVEVKTKDEVDKGGQDRVKPLLAALKEVRHEVSNIIAELRDQPQSKT